MSKTAHREGITRRHVVAGIAGVAGLAALPGLVGGESQAEGEPPTEGKSGSRMPVVYLPHGGGPWPFVEMGLDKRDIDKLVTYLQSVRKLPKEPPKALLVVSAHWEERVPTLMTSPRPPMLYDYYGFPAGSYEITWPAPGSPALASRVEELLSAAGLESAKNDSRGFDHGTFIPLKVTYPDADIPTLQLSMLASLDPEEHIRLGRALAPLRDEGVLILGSGMSFHNLRAFRDPRGHAISETFDAWLRETAVLRREERDGRLVDWKRAPSARAAHPREEHLLPLMVAAGAAGDDLGVVAFSDLFMGVRISAVHFG